MKTSNIESFLDMSTPPLLGDAELLETHKEAKKELKNIQDKDWHDFRIDQPQDNEEVLWFIKTQYKSPHYRTGCLKGSTIDLHVMHYDIQDLKKDLLARIYWCRLPDISEIMKRRMDI